VEQKPEVRKAGGVYYTPQIHRGLYRQAHGGVLCEAKTPAQSASCAILDPLAVRGLSCWRAYQHLLDYHLNWYVEHPTKQARREVYQGRGGDWFLTTDEKKRILDQQPHGVDIDPQAVEVTKLSLLLRVLEGRTQETIAEQRRLWQERALPDLADNIKCGNSLIGPGYYQAQQLGLLDEEEAYRVNAFGLGEGVRQGHGGGRVRRGDWNPPYVRIQTMKEWAPNEVEFYKQRYVAASKGNYDIYVVFVEKGLSLLNERGRLGYILPHKFFKRAVRRAAAGPLAEGRHLGEVVHFGRSAGV